MSDNASPIPTPALIDILCILELRRRNFFGQPNDEFAPMAVTCIEWAAERASREQKAFTVEYLYENLTNIGYCQEILECACELIQGKELQDFADVVRLLEWLYRRINSLKGLPVPDIREAVKRAADGRHLSHEGGYWQGPSLDHVAAKLAEFDSEGRTKKFWEKVWKESSMVRECIEEIETSADADRHGGTQSATANGASGKGNGNRPGQPAGFGPSPAGASHSEEERLTEAELSEVFKALPLAAQKAYLAFQFAETKAECKLQDQEAFKLLEEEGIPTDRGRLGELTEYELPNFQTWSRQLRAARQQLGEQKYNRRGRQPTRSIVKAAKSKPRTRNKAGE